MPEVNWTSFNAMAQVDEAEYMLQLLRDYSNEQESDPSFGPMFWSVDEAANMVETDGSLNYCSSDMVNSACLYSWSQSNGGSQLFSTSNYESYHMGDANLVSLNKSPATMDLCVMDELNSSSSLQVATDNLFEDIVCLTDEMSSENLGESNLNLLEAAVLPNQILQTKRKMRAQQCDKTMLDENNCNNNTGPTESPKKKSRISGNNARNIQSKKNQKTVKGADEEESSAALNGQSSSSCSSEDDSNTASQEMNGASSSSKGPAALNLNGKRKASRGTATDPQSLYARKRRERINERLRILQNLVPNGTKVDISTMLDEAVQYVKFLQLQIKLLSSEDMWIYAPLAYNGMDIGLDLKITAPR
ncbi:hypothetical protein AAC387_Pa05g2668 [Persea americana]